MNNLNSDKINSTRYSINNFNEIEYYEEDAIINPRINTLLYNSTLNKIIKNSEFYHNNEVNKLDDVIEYVEYCKKVEKLAKEVDNKIEVIILDKDDEFIYVPVIIFQRMSLIRSISFIDSMNTISTELFDPVLLDNERNLGISGMETENPYIVDDVKFIDMKGEFILSEIIYYMTAITYLDDEDNISPLLNLLEDIYGEIAWQETSKVFITYLDGLKYAISFKGFKRIYDKLNLFDIGGLDE